MFLISLFALFVHLANADILPNSVVAQTAGDDLFKLENPANIKLINSEEKPIISVITRSLNFACPLFYQRIVDGDSHYKNPYSIAPKTFPSKLQGIPYFELKANSEHTFISTKSGNILLMFNSKRIENLQPLLKNATRLDNYEMILNNGDTFCLYKKHLKQNEVLNVPAGVVVGGFAYRTTKGKTEKLYNGIEISSDWQTGFQMNSSKPMDIPYLKNPPKEIDIDVGRQLFIDDFLIEKTNMVREFHMPKKYEGNPILKPETNLETTSRYGNNPVSAPLSGSVLWNPEKQVFQMWYEAGHLTNFAYAESKDGLNWTRPNLHIEKGTNRVLPREYEPDSWTVFNDFDETDPSKKFKMFFRSHDDAERRAMMFTSPDGINWTGECEMGRCGDRSTMIYNPFRKKWVASIRFWNGCKDSYGFRNRAYFEADSFENAMDWHPYEPIFWARADELDYRGKWQKHKHQLYNLDGVAYESIMLGVFQIMYGPDNGYWADRGMPKSTGLNFAYSRDGFHWYRPDRTLFVKSDHNSTWDNGYIQSVSNVLCVMGDKLYIYYSGFKGDTTKTRAEIKKKYSDSPGTRSGMYSGGATGVMFLRRDGFASMNANGKTSELLTKSLKFSGGDLFVNADVKHGKLLAQVEDATGKPIFPYTFENCVAFSGDSTIENITWQNGDTLEKIGQRAVRIRFKIEGHGKLYAFWVSRDTTGRSDGYVAGGGKGFTSNRDTIGKKAYK